MVSPASPLPPTMIEKASDESSFASTIRSNEAVVPNTPIASEVYQQTMTAPPPPINKMLKPPQSKIYQQTMTSPPPPASPPVNKMFNASTTRMTTHQPIYSIGDQLGKAKLRKVEHSSSTPQVATSSMPFGKSSIDIDRIRQIRMAIAVQEYSGEDYDIEWITDDEEGDQEISDGFGGRMRVRQVRVAKKRTAITPPVTQVPIKMMSPPRAQWKDHQVSETTHYREPAIRHEPHVTASASASSPTASDDQPVATARSARNFSNSWIASHAKNVILH